MSEQKSTRYAGPRIPAGTMMAMALMTATPCFAQVDGKIPSPEELWRIIQQQQAEIEELKATLGARDGQVPETISNSPGVAAQPDQERLEEIEQRIAATEQGLEATAAAVERRDVGAADGWWQRTTIGGYGELHYNGGDKDEIDFHRFVLFAGHRFNDWLRFQSELEIEHADDEKNGAVELEQAWLEADLSESLGLHFGESDHHYARAGLFLVPVGILNETHEPPTFFGVERNSVEGQIIPSTWREAGAGLNGRLGGGFSYDVVAHSGLDVSSTTFAIRGGRQSVSEAPAKDPAFTARVKWSGIPGLELGVSGQYQKDLTQDELGLDATLLEAHADILKNGFGLRALYARWDLEGQDAVKALGRDEQYGWYVEPSYRFATSFGTLGVFARHELWDTQAGLKGVDTQFEVTVVGLNYWPDPNVVLKFDYQFEDTPVGRADDDRINLAVGYQF